MGVPLNFYKVTVLPATPEPDTFYFVSNGDYAESYLTTNTGVAKKIGNSAMIEALTQNINAGFFT